MAEDLFESAWAKWGMAVLDSKVLEENIHAFAAHEASKTDYFSVTQYYDPKRHWIVLSASDVINPSPVLWGMRLGNVVHNFRSCLDHIAWAIYKRGRKSNLPKGKEALIYFPLAKERLEFNKSLPTKLPGAKRADIAIVRSYQPYKGGKRYAQHALFVLDKLSKLDKHRAIQPVAPIPETGSIAVVGAIDCDVRGMSPWSGRREVLKEGTELARFYVRKTGPNPHIEVQPDFTVYPSIDEQFSLAEWVDLTTDVVASLLHRFAKPPKGLAEMLIAADQDVPRARGPRQF